MCDEVVERREERITKVYREPMSFDNDHGTVADTVKTEDLPDCSEPQSKDLWIDYCQSSSLNDTQKHRISDTLNDIAQRGAVCKKIAQRGRLYLNKGIIRVYPDPTRAGG